jgi:uncharacterized protein
MRLAVLDTNVIVSAGIRAEGAPAHLMMDWVLAGRVAVVTCPAIVAEYREVVRRRKFRRYGFPPIWLEFLIEESLQLPDPLISQAAVPDPKDAVFLSLTQVAGAWLVTGNLKHFPENGRSGAVVLSPAEYLVHLAGQGTVL